MKLCNWNIEWMNRWFSADSQTLEWKSPDFLALGNRVARVIKKINPDVLTIQEGPSRRVEMALFVQDCLGDTYDLIGPGGKGQQKLYVLVQRDGEVSSAAEAVPNVDIDLGDPWAVDIDGNMILDEYDFTREPQVVDLALNDGRSIQVINIHLKSKYVHNGERLWNDPAQKHQFIKLALLARRRISAEAMRVREYLNASLKDDTNKAIIVCGDFNDGPGNDYFERLYLTHNLVAVISGNPFRPNVMMRHGFIGKDDDENNYTAVFDDFIDDVKERKILLDHILVSPLLAGSLSNGRVEHNAFESEVDSSLLGRFEYPSDHRPQSISI